MKRLWIAGGLLISILVLCWGSVVYQHRQIDRLIVRLNDIEHHLAEETAENLKNEIEVFVDDYEKQTRLFPCFMNHSGLEEAREMASSLLLAAKYGDTDKTHQGIQLLRLQLQIIQEEEKPLLHNVL